MYRKDKPPHGPPPPHPRFGPPLPHGYPFRYRGPSSGPPPGHLPPRPCRPFSSSAPGSHYVNNSSPRGHFIRPPCSSYSIDHSTVVALGSSQQIVPPADPPGLQVPQWNAKPVQHHPSDNSDQAGEEFLRCIAANKPLPDYLKGNMAYNLADAFKSANVLKEAVKSDPEVQKHFPKSKSRSRSRGRSRGKSRAKSRARSKSRVRSRSRGRSKSRVRSRSRGRSRGRSKSRDKGRAKSQARSKSKARSRSRSRSRSQNRSKSCVRSKSRVRRSRSSSSEMSRDSKRKRSPDRSSNSSNSLLEGLKLVMNSKELEERLPTLKDAIVKMKASGERKTADSERSSRSPENDSMLLPHERVGSDFSWLQGNRQHDSPVQKADELEDEESFLYGNESGQNGGQTKPPEMDCSTAGTQYQQNKSLFSRLEDMFDPIQRGSSNSVLDRIDFEKVKSLSKNLGTLTNLSEIMAKVKEQPCAPIPTETAAVNLALPSLSNPNVRQALESLQSLIRATKEKRTKSDDPPQTSCDKQKARGAEDRRKERLNKISQMESTGKELEELLNQDGMSFLIPVIGFYCQKCEEFIGDICSAEKHGASHQQSNSSTHKMPEDRHARDNKGQYHSSTSSQDHRDYGYHRDSGEHRNSRDYQRHHDSEHRSHRPEHQENQFMKDEMKRERMFITVSRGMTPPNIKVKEEVKKEQLDRDGKDKSSKNSRESRERDESSDSSDGDRETSPRSKHAKKKKKKEKKKKKKKEREKERKS